MWVTSLLETARHEASPMQVNTVIIVTICIIIINHHNYYYEKHVKTGG